MRRLTIIALLLSSLALGWTIPKRVPTEPNPPDDTARGLVYSGLRRQAGPGPCRGNFEISGIRDRGGRPVCTPGPDPAPPGVDIRRSPNPVPATAQAAAPAPPSGVAAQGSVPCDGDGTSGYRVQLIYARAANVPDRFPQYAASFQQWAGAIDSTFSRSAAETGGDRRVRYVHDASCNAVVDRVTLSTRGADDFNNTLNELRSKGYSRTDRKYIVWTDAYVYCGIAQVYFDDSAGPMNYSNGNPYVPGEVGRIDAGCWGQSASSEAHELMHTLGGVQTSAPNATTRNHCTDEYDRMCYADGGGGPMRYLCPPAHESLFDCNHDDYFSTAPPPGSYLATRWNTANSRFLIGSGSPPTTTTTGPPITTPATTTTTTAPPTTTTSPPPTQPTSTTTAPPTAGVPSAPQSFYATQPREAGANGVVLFWLPPAAPNGAITGYRVYRSSSPAELALLTTIAPGTSFSDTSALSGRLYYYELSAVNAAGEGPRSNLARMVGR